MVHSSKIYPTHDLLTVVILYFSPFSSFSSFSSRDLHLTVYEVCSVCLCYIVLYVSVCCNLLLLVSGWWNLASSAGKPKHYTDCTCFLNPRNILFWHHAYESYTTLCRVTFDIRCCVLYISGMFTYTFILLLFLFLTGSVIFMKFERFQMIQILLDTTIAALTCVMVHMKTPKNSMI